MSIRIAIAAAQLPASIARGLRFDLAPGCMAIDSASFILELQVGWVEQHEAQQGAMRRLCWASPRGGSTQPTTGLSGAEADAPS